MNTVFSYGEIGIDNIIQVPQLPSPELAVFPTSDSYHIGGAAANYAVLLASWGIPVGLTGNAIGQDAMGEQLLTEMRQYKSLDLQYLSVDRLLSTPFCRILVTPNAERSILVFNYPAMPRTLLTREMLAGVSYLALDLYGGEERLAAARLARELGVTTIVNDLISTEHPVFPYSDIIINSAAYIRSELPGVSVTDHALKLHKKFGAVVITTDGPNTVVGIDRHGRQYFVKPPKITAVDATGAGDAFRAGLTYGLIEGWGWEKCIRAAIAAGSLKVGSVGAVSQPPTIERILGFSAEVFPDFSRK